MKQNIKMKNNIKIGIGLLLVVIIIFIGILFLKDKNNITIKTPDIKENGVNTNYSTENLDIEIKLYNKILKEAKSIGDLEKCDELKISDIFNTCTASIKLKYGEIGTVKELTDCEKVSATETETKEFRIDICKYNLLKNMNKKEIDYKKKCSEIINLDIQKSCMFNFEK